ncbi:MAG: hypothetical protein AAFP04_13475 [Myxococcota bacterium]
MNRPLLIGAIGVLALGSLSFVLVGTGASPEDLTGVQRALFVLTYIFQLATLVAVFRLRALYAPDEPKRVQWTLFSGFFLLRVIAETRLMTLYFDWIPSAIGDDATLKAIYLDGLRFLYTLSDLLLIAGLAYLWNALAGFGGREERPRLRLRVGRGDIPWLALLPALPIAAFALRKQMANHTITADGAGAPDPWLQLYRLMAVVLSTVTVGLCAILLGYSRQMGGGAVARIWTCIVAAGIARALSFVALAVFTLLSTGVAVIVEQAFLFYFVWCWWTAVRLERDVATF